MTEGSLLVSESPGLDGTAVLRVAGELDLASAQQLTDEVAERLADHAREVVLDLREVSLIDSSGAGALLAVRRRCERGGSRLVLVLSAGGAVRRLLARLELERLFDVVVPNR